MNDQALNIKFVQKVEEYPCLYNYKLTDYSRKDVIERAWSEVGKVFNLTGKYLYLIILLQNMIPLPR